VKRWPMVLADDLTGAAELAGTAARYGLPALVLTEPCEPVTGVVCCYDTGTRSLTAAEARQRSADFTRAALSDHHWLYKKTDSVLRGQPRVEIETLLPLTGQTRSILCPANPRRGRTILGGQYFIDGRPLTEHPVAADPDHPRPTDDVRSLLGESSVIELPDIPNPAALNALAHQIAAHVLPAGGEEFFAALLEAQGQCLNPPKAGELPRPWLFVNGSLAAWQRRHTTEGKQPEFPCFTIDQWPGPGLAPLLAQHGLVMLAIGENKNAAPGALLTTLIDQARQLLHDNHFGTVFLEGGATARAFMDHFGWRRFDVLGELEPGCVALQPSTAQNNAARAPVLVLKPGSYAWPAAAWNHDHFTTMV
jgi:D-threonate/D-erythronate kinase